MVEPLPATLLTDDGLAVRLFAVLPAPPSEVWPYLTDPAQSTRWSPIVADRFLDTVGPALSREEPDQDPVTCDVLAVEAPHLLKHRWGPDRVCWALQGTPDGTRLVVEQHTSTREMAASLAAGWTGCLDTLARLLSGQDVPRIVGEESLKHGWTELNAHYCREFGVAASDQDATSA